MEALVHHKAQPAARIAINFLYKRICQFCALPKIQIQICNFK